MGTLNRRKFRNSPVQTFVVMGIAPMNAGALVSGETLPHVRVNVGFCEPRCEAVAEAVKAAPFGNISRLNYIPVYPCPVHDPCKLGAKGPGFSSL